jgi:methionyl-tRNA synthetase
MITLDEFRNIDLRVAQIMSAQRIEKANRLLKVEVDLGGERRTLIAGLGAHYNPEELIGLKVIVVANMQPAVIRGIESNGMLLGAGCHDDTNIALLTINRELPIGTRVE